MKRIKLSKGFTLIELLVVIAIVGVLAGAVWVAINPLDKIRAANDSNRQSDIGAMATAMEAYAAAHDGYYAVTQQDLIDSGDLKSDLTDPVSDTAYTLINLPAACDGTVGNECTDFRVCATMESLKYVTPGTTEWIYGSTNGKSCAQIPDAGGACLADCN